jgi:hypothetical protein
MARPTAVPARPVFLDLYGASKVALRGGACSHREINGGSSRGSVRTGSCSIELLHRRALPCVAH